MIAAPGPTTDCDALVNTMGCWHDEDQRFLSGANLVWQRDSHILYIVYPELRILKIDNKIELLKGGQAIHDGPIEDRSLPVPASDHNFSKCKHF